MDAGDGYRREIDSMERFLFILEGKKIEMASFSNYKSGDNGVVWHKHQDEYGYEVPAGDALDGFWQWFQQESGIGRSHEIAVLLIEQGTSPLSDSLCSLLRDKCTLVGRDQNVWDVARLQKLLQAHFVIEKLTYDGGQQAFQTEEATWSLAGPEGTGTVTLTERIELHVPPEPVLEEKVEEEGTAHRVFSLPLQGDAGPEKTTAEGKGPDTEGLKEGQAGHCTGADLKRYLQEVTKDHCDTIG